MNGYEIANGAMPHSMEIKSGKDHVVVLRSTVDFGSKSMSMSFLGEQRPLSDAEFIEKVKKTNKHPMKDIEGLYQQYLIND